MKTLLGDERHDTATSPGAATSVERHREGERHREAERAQPVAAGERPFRVGITGSYGGLNLGDEAILQSIVAQLRRALPVEITVFSRDAEDTRRRHGVERAVPVRRLSRAEVAPEVERLDLLILGGGGILYDADARTYLREVTIARDKGVPVMVYAIGAGPLSHAAATTAVR